ncbi:MAG: pyrimidine-nucleoside phosphorylase, partial [Chloroflexi bacterium]|nr:pyrimidine-nucleoside phosphorylase [Chloroflexota bacterium]
AQGGDARVADDPDRLPRARLEAVLEAPGDGYLAEVDALQVGHAAMLLGAGRQKKGDAVDPGAGLLLARKVGEEVRRGERLATLYSNQPEGLERALQFLQGAFSLSPERVAPSPLFLGKVGIDG